MAAVTCVELVLMAVFKPGRGRQKIMDLDVEVGVTEGCCLPWSVLKHLGHHDTYRRMGVLFPWERSA